VIDKDPNLRAIISKERVERTFMATFNDLCRAMFSLLIHPPRFVEQGTMLLGFWPSLLKNKVGVLSGGKKTITS